MTPYTIDAVRQIRTKIGEGIPLEYIRGTLGWDAAFFDRVCRKHGIDVAPLRMQRAVDPEPPPSRPVSAYRVKLKPRVKHHTAGFHITFDEGRAMSRLARRDLMLVSQRATVIIQAAVDAGNLGRFKVRERPRPGFGCNDVQITASLPEPLWLALKVEADGRDRCTVGKLVQSIIKTFLEEGERA